MKKILGLVIGIMLILGVFIFVGNEFGEVRIKYNEAQFEESHDNVKTFEESIVHEWKTL